MFDFLFEGGQGLYLALLLLGLILVVCWTQWPSQRYLFALGCLVVLALLLLLLDVLRETDRERAIRTLNELTASLNDKQYDAAFNYFGDDFQAYGMNKQVLKAVAVDALKRYAVRNIHHKSLQIKTHDRVNRSLTLRFNAIADSSAAADWRMLPVEVDFVFDAQNRCRVKSFRIYRPFVDNVDPWNVFQEAGL